MAILVTRAHPGNEATASNLRARGYDVWLAPVLKFEPVAFRDEGEPGYKGIIVTSANAIRAIESRLQELRLLKLPLFAVGEATGSAARAVGFAEVTVAGGDAEFLLETVLQAVRDKVLKKKDTLLYLAGAEVSRDITPELRAAGLDVVRQTAYRMAPVKHLPRNVCDGFAANGIEAVLHYSRRSALAFLEATRSEGVEISALAIPHCCLSETIAGVLREAGAAQVAVAGSPDENALFGTLERALRTRLA